MSRWKVIRLIVIAALIALFFYYYGGHQTPPGPRSLDTNNTDPQLEQIMQQFIADHPQGAAEQLPWTPPSAVYTVPPDPDYQPGTPCLDHDQCTTHPDAPSQITIFTHSGDPYEQTHPTYAHDYCMQLMAETAPGTTCTVRPDPGDTP